MSWIHDTGYGPALDHEGGVGAVLEDGTDASTPPDQLGPRVIGWRAGCECGWQGTQFYLRAESPSSEYAHAPEDVEQHCMAEWERHLRTVLPLLAIHDLSRQLALTQDELTAAVGAARADGVSWAVIGEAAGVTAESAHKRWSTPADHESGLPTSQDAGRNTDHPAG